MRHFVWVLLALLATPGWAQVEIRWEIVNRFAPFEALDNPEAVFETYRLTETDHDFDGWHARLDARPGGMVSPYADALRRGRGLHWDPDLAGHSDTVLRYVQRESDRDTRIRVRAWVVDADTGAPLTGKLCRWNKRGLPAPCDSPITFSMMLRGEIVSVSINGTTTRAFLAPDHVVILGLGDSYSSGEGNPDVPAKWRTINFNATGQVGYEWLGRARNYDMPETGRWIDDRCHRSFFSYQSLTALRMASEDPHRFVSFLHYACSGAEIFDGVLTPQFQAFAGDSYVPYAQVNAAVRELCRVPVARNQPRVRGEYWPVTDAERDGIRVADLARRNGSLLLPNDKLDGELRRYRTETGSDIPVSGLMSCPDGLLRKPDHVFLTIGGNDMGFGEVVRYFLLPSQYDDQLVSYLALPALCPSSAYRVDARRFPRAAEHCFKLDARGDNAGFLIHGTRANGQRNLPMVDRVTLLFNVLEHRLRVPPETFAMSQYPDPLRLYAPATPTCELLDGADLTTYGPVAPAVDPFSAWNGLKASVPLNIAETWRLVITRDEARLALRQFDELRVVLATTAQRRGVRFACDSRDAFIGHGWWLGRHLNLPNAGPRGHVHRWDVADWEPYDYDPTGRAIRTANDSALTQPKTATQGLFHPNLTGHRLMAESFFALVSPKPPAE